MMKTKTLLAAVLLLCLVAVVLLGLPVTGDAFLLRGGGAASTGTCTIVSVSESGSNSFTGNPNGDASGTTVGTLGITTSGSCASPTWTVSDSTNFKVSGSSLQTNGTPAPANYSGLTATATIAGATGSPMATTPFTVTGTGITNVTLTSTWFSPGSSSGTTVGAIAVPEVGGTFSGTLSITGTDAASFQLSSSTLPSNLQTNGVLCGSPPCSYSINLVATQAGHGASPKTVPFTIDSNTGTMLTTFTFKNSSGTTMPAGQMVSFGQAFPRGAGGFNPTTNCVKIRNAADHADLVYQLDEIATRRENGDDGTVRHLVWSAQWPSTLSDGATGQVEFVTTGSACGAPAQKQSLAALAAAHDIKIVFTDVRNQDATTRDSGTMTFSVNDAASNTGRDAPKKYAQGPVRDGWIVRGAPVYATSGNKDPLIYVTCFLDLTTDVSDQTSLGKVRHTCRVDSPWEKVAAGTAGNSGSPGPVGFTNDPQAVSYRPEYKDGSTSLLDWSWLDASVASGSNPINTSNGQWTIPTSTGSDQWYSGQTLLYSTAGTPPTGMTNNKLYFACPCDNAGNVDGVDTHNSLWDAPWTVGGATAITPSSQGSGTQTFSYRVWHTKWTAWHTIDQSAHDSWTNGTARAVWIVDPALTDTEATYWASTGMVPPIDRTQVPDTDILDVGKRLSQNTEPLSMMNVSGSSNVGGRQEIGIINEYTSQAWILQNKDSWQKARVTAYAAPSYPFAHVLNEATGYIPALNNGPPTGPGGNGVGGSYADLGAPQPHTYILSDVGGDYEGLATPLQSVPVVAYTSGYGMGLYGRGRVWRNDHYPMYAGVTYLLYGNRHFLEMAYFAGNRVDIVNDYGGSEGQSRDWLPGGSNHYYGLCVPTGGEPRASYWCMRDKQNGAAWGGDSNPERAYFNDQLVEQANFWPLFELWKDGGSAGNFTNGLFYDWNREQQESSFMGTYATWAYYMGYTMLRSPQATYSLNYRIPRYWLAVVGDLPGGLSSWYGSAASYSRTNARKNIQLANPTGIGANIGSLYSTDPADMGTSLEYAVFNHTNIDGSVTASGDTLTTWFGVVQLTNGDLYKDQGNLYGGGPDQLDDSTWYTVSNVNNTTHTFKLINPATGTPFTGYTLGGSPYVCYVYCGMFHFQYGPSTSWWDDNTNYAPYAYSSVIALKILGLGTYTLLGRTIDDAYNTVVTRGPGLRAKETVLGWDVSVVVP